MNSTDTPEEPKPTIEVCIHPPDTTKSEGTKQVSKAEVLLANILKAVDNAKKLAAQTKSLGSEAVAEAIKAGRLLKQIKDRLKHGEWEAWLRNNVPNISHSTACRWIRLAAKSITVTDLEEKKITSAYRACGILPTPDPAKPNKTSAPEVLLKTADKLQQSLAEVASGKIEMGAEKTEELQVFGAQIEQSLASIFDKPEEDNPTQIDRALSILHTIDEASELEGEMAELFQELHLLIEELAA